MGKRKRRQRRAKQGTAAPASVAAGAGVTAAVPVSAAPATPAARAPEAARKVSPSRSRALAGGRLSMDTESTWWGIPRVIAAPTSAEDTWRTLDLDSETLDTTSPAELMQLLADLSPDISRALWDFLRLANPGWEADAFLPGQEEQDGPAQAALDAFLARLSDQYGAVDVVIGRLLIGAFLRGAFFGELVLDEAGRLPIDLATPDPASVRFEQVTDPGRGMVWRPGQYQNGQWVNLDRPTIRYIPVDPFPGSPFGRPLASAALFSTLFLLGLLHDLRRVVSQQGYPRLDLSVSLERLLTVMPQDLSLDPDALQNWVNAVVSEITTVYSKLEPDDAYVHTDVITVNRPVGAVDAQSLSAVDGLITALERFNIRALKTMPLLMGVNETSSETHANRQWEVHAAGIKSLQHLVEQMLERLLGLALECQGIRAVVRFRFGELRAAELLRDAQVEQLQTQNAQAQYNAGWISQDEAAQTVVGHPADAPEPRIAAGLPVAAPLANVQADPGANRGTTNLTRRRGGAEVFRAQSAGEHGPDCNCGAERTPGGPTRGVKIIPEGAEEPLPAVPDEVTISEADIRRAVNAWDELMPDYAGLLEAAVIGQANFDVSGQQAAPVSGMRAYGDASPWTWDPHAAGGGRYRNTETGRWLGARQMVGLRDQFLQAQRDALIGDDLADALVAGDVSVQQWVLQSRQFIKTAFVDQYAIAHGGRHNMTLRDWGILGRMCRDQYSFLNDFGQAIADGDLSAGQIRARARMYIDASVQAYERGRSEELGIPVLPAYPGDGSSECRSNDRCHWEFEETDDTWECSWILDQAAENCQTCLDRAATWNPLVVTKV